MGKKTQITFVIDEKLKAALDEYVKARGMTLRGYITLLIKKGIKWTE